MPTMLVMIVLGIPWMLISFGQDKNEGQRFITYVEDVRGSLVLKINYMHI